MRSKNGLTRNSATTTTVDDNTEAQQTAVVELGFCGSRRRKKERRDASVPPATDSSALLDEHLGAHRQYWRDIILGVNDGIVSTFLLVSGVAGGGLESKEILLTALAGALAGAVSMAAGEYVATKSQNEVMQGEIALEQTHISQCLESEIAEIGSSAIMRAVELRNGIELGSNLLQLASHCDDVE